MLIPHFLFLNITASKSSDRSQMSVGFAVVSDGNRKAGSLHLQINTHRLYEGDVEEFLTHILRTYKHNNHHSTFAEADVCVQQR